MHSPSPLESALSAYLLRPRTRIDISVLLRASDISALVVLCDSCFLGLLLYARPLFDFETAVSPSLVVCIPLRPRRLAFFVSRVLVSPFHLCCSWLQTNNLPCSYIYIPTSTHICISLHAHTILSLSRTLHTCNVSFHTDLFCFRSYIHTYSYSPYVRYIVRSLFIPLILIYTRTHVYIHIHDYLSSSTFHVWCSDALSACY